MLIFPWIFSIVTIEKLDESSRSKAKQTYWQNVFVFTDICAVPGLHAGLLSALVDRAALAPIYHKKIKS